MDVFVLVSWTEAQPRALLEAGATGLPAIATDIPACRDVLGQSVGYLVPVTNPLGHASVIFRRRLIQTAGDYSMCSRTNGDRITG